MANLERSMAATERELRVRDTEAAQRAADPRAPITRPGDPANAIEFRGVSKAYDVSKAGLHDATFAVRRGEFVFLVGQTGSGKSTLMKLLIKELEPDAGRILVAGRDLSELTHKQLPFYRRNLGVVFQDFKLLPNRTVHDNVAYALQVDRQQAQGDPRQGAGHPAPDGPLDEAPPLPRPAVRR